MVEELSLSQMLVMDTRQDARDAAPANEANGVGEGRGEGGEVKGGRGVRRGVGTQRLPMELMGEGKGEKGEGMGRERRGRGEREGEGWGWGEGEEGKWEERGGDGGMGMGERGVSERGGNGGRRRGIGEEWEW